MQYNGHAKVQHYVPQFLLKNFGKGKNSSVFVYDKQLQKSYKTNTRNIAGESKFYDFDLNLGSVHLKGSIEEKLSEIESNANKALKKIINTDSISKIDDLDKKNISIFLAVQVARTKNLKVNYDTSVESLKKVIQRMNCSSESLRELELSNEEKKFYFDKFIVEESQRLASLFYNRIWILAKNDTKIPFCIGDDPVVYYNEFENKFDSSFLNPHGLGIVGTMVYLPITPTHLLYLFCPEKAKEIIKTIELIKHLILYCPQLYDDIEIRKKLKANKRIYDCLLNNMTVLFNENQVQHINSLEAISAERFIISSNNDFNFIKEVLDKSEHKYHGKRMELL